MIRNLRPLVSSIVSLSMAFAICSAAEVRREDSPASTTMKVGAIATVQVLDVAPVDRQALLAEDTARAAQGPGPLRFAVPEDVVISPSESGSWEMLPNGGRLWRLRIHAPNATDLNFGFTKYRLPPGATLHIMSENDGFFQGPFTVEDNKAHGEFWTPVVPGARAVIELYVPADPEFEPDLELTRIGRGYRGFFSKADDQTKQLSCNIDVVCNDGNAWRDEIRSVALFTFTEGANQYACSSTLIMDVPGSFTPYLLSAQHCGVTTTNDQTVRAYWNFESPSCGQLGGGSLSQSQNGAIFRASREDNDMLLLELEDTPAASFNVHYAGWDARTSTRPQSSVHIHHPAGDEKAITFNDDPLTIVGHCLGGGPSDTHWYANVYDRGTTERGSSGSGVWDPATHYLVGYLSAGNVDVPCGSPVSDCHGRIAIGWDGPTSSSRLRDWLDPGNTNTLTKTGANPSGGSNGGSGSWDCGNAGYDNNATANATYFGGGHAGDPDYMFAVKFELADFGYQPGGTQITGFCAANNIAFTGGPWPNEVFIYPDSGGMPNDSTVLGQGTIATGDGTGPVGITLAAPVTLNGDFWLVMRGDPMHAGEDFNMEYDDSGLNIGNSYASDSGIAGLSLSTLGNLMLRATLQETSNGGGDGWDCGNAGYDNNTTANATYFGGGHAGDPNYMFAVKFELSDFGYQAGNAQITGFCAANQIAFTGGPWPNEVFIYPDSGGMPNASTILGQGTISTGDGTGPSGVTLASPVTLNSDFWLVMRGDPMHAGEDFNMEYDTGSNVGNSYSSDSGISGLSLSTLGNFMLRATLQEGSGGGGPGNGAYNYFLAAIAHTPGVGDALWRSKLGALNRSGSSAEVTFTYYWKNGPTTVKAAVAKRAISHGSLMTWDDAAVSLFGITAKSSGSVLVNSTRPLVITARTYNVGEDGSFGSFMPGVTAAADGLSTGEMGVLSQLTGNNDFRTNVGLVNLSNKSCQARVRVVRSGGAAAGSPVNQTLGAYKFTQINDVFDATGAGSLNDAYVTVEVLTSGCQMWAYGAVIDGTGAFPGTDDATTIPLTVID